MSTSLNPCQFLTRHPLIDRNSTGKKKDDYNNFCLIKEGVLVWILIFMFLFLMSLALYALFDHEYKLWDVNVNNKTVDSFIC